MSTAAQGASSAAAEPAGVVIDDPFTPEEAAAFEQMESETGGDPGAPPAGDTPPAPPVDPAADPALAAGDPDDDDDADPQAQQQPGDKQPQLGPDGKPLPRRVNYGKYARMEDRAKRAETELQQVKEMFTRTDERLKLLNDALTAGQQRKVDDQREEDPEPDPEKDIFGWVQWARRDRQRMVEQLNGQQQRVQATEQDNAMTQTYTEDARAFQAQEPTFIPAYNYLMQSRAVELAQYFFGKDLFAGEQLTPQESLRIKQSIVNEERELVAEALKTRQSPAKRIYALARARGFRPENVKPPQQNGQAQPAQNGQAAPAQTAPAQVPSVAAEIANIQRGTRTPSLSQGGGAPASPLTAEKLANMSEDEFAHYVERMTQDQMRAMFGD